MKKLKAEKEKQEKRVRLKNKKNKNKNDNGGNKKDSQIRNSSMLNQEGEEEESDNEGDECGDGLVVGNVNSDDDTAAKLKGVGKGVEKEKER